MHNWLEGDDPTIPDQLPAYEARRAEESEAHRTRMAQLNEAEAKADAGYKQMLADLAGFRVWT